MASTSSMDRSSASLNSNSFHSAEEEPSLIASTKPFTYAPHPLSITSAYEQHHVQTAQGQLHLAVTTKNVDLITVLLKNMKVDVPLKDGRTALMLASAEGDTKIMTLLLDHGAAVDAMDPEGWTPLHFASSYGNYDATKVLVKHFADVNKFTKDGTPMLLRPASKGFSIVTEYLLLNKSRPNDSDGAGITPLIVAAKKGHKDVVRVLLENGADPRIATIIDARTAMIEAVKGEHAEIVAMLTRTISQAMEKSLQLFKVKTAEEVRRLLREGVRVDERRGDGVTPLMAASEQGNLEVVQELVDQHAILDLQDQDGLSALMVASRNSHDPVVQLLIANQAIIDLKSKKKWTALMYAVHHGHIKVVRSLLAARADPTVRDGSGKTAHDLAKERKHNEILEHLSRQSVAVVDIADPFMRQLSAHLLEKERSSDDSKKKRTQTAARRDEGSKALMRRPPEGDGGTVKDELSKAWQRIAELETRNHDLTIQTTMGPLDSSDLSYLERSRLEEEYRKTKELKRKAEQYAIDAKQTAQRLSAENFKLKEDLSREQHFNELTRKSMMTEIEEKVKQMKRSGELAEVKREEFEKASKQHAMDIVSRMGLRAGKMHKANIDPSTLKHTILSETITMDVLQIAITGLPDSGKSTLLDQILGIKSIEDRHKHSQAVIANGMCLFETVAVQDSHHPVYWFTSAKASPEVVVIAVALAKVCSRKFQIPNLVNITSACWGEDDPVLDSHFRDTLHQVDALLKSTDKEGKLDQLANSSLSLINWWDVNVTKVSYEAASILAGHCRNFLNVNVLSLPKHGLCLNQPLTVEAQPRQQQPSPSDDIQMLLRILPAFHYYFRAISVCCQETKLPRSALLVGTFADKFKRDTSNLQRAKMEVLRSIKARAQEIGISEVVAPALIAVDATKDEGCRKVWGALREMIAMGQRFKQKVHLKWILLRSTLLAVQSTFILRTKVFRLAKKCGFHDNNELNECLSLFQSCGSVICSNSGKIAIPALDEYIIVNPLKFLSGVGKLYYYEHTEEEAETRKYIKNGFISGTLAKQLWGDEHRIYLQILQDMGVLVCVSEILQEDPDFGWKERVSCYFMPSLRSGRYETPLTSQSTSLVITVPSELPFQSQADFVLYFKTHYQHKIKVVPNESFNAMHFKWCDPSRPKETADIHIRFLSGYGEISIIPSSSLTGAQSKSIHRNLCSICKTATVEVCYELAQVLPDLRYQLSVVCPNSSDDVPHFIHFHALEVYTGQDMMCLSCNDFIKMTDERVWWIEAAYQGPLHQALHPDDALTQSLLRELAHALSVLSRPQLLSLSSALGFSESEVSSRQFTSHGDLVLQLLMEWQRRVPACTKQSLASALLKCGHYQLAMKLDPSMYATNLPLQ